MSASGSSVPSASAPPAGSLAPYRASDPSARRTRPIAVIAGGSAGIGRATAELLAREGHDVAVLARGEARLREAEGSLRALGARAIGIVCDVGDMTQVRAARERVLAELGEPDVWVNSAMLTIFGPFETLSDDEFRKIVDTTFMGQVNGTRAALEGMRPRGHGRIVNISSGLSYRSVPLQSAYCASKHAVNGFSSALRSELIHDGFEDLTISLVQLPAVNTPQFDWARYRTARPPRPAAPVYQPEVAARGVWKAIRSGAREILVGPPVLGLMFGDMLAPGALDRKLASAGYDGQISDRPPQGERDDNLDGPADKAVGARGSFGDEARDDGLIVDGDQARLGVFGGAALLLFAVGLLAGKRLRDS